jgi:hypothetical protein
MIKRDFSNSDSSHQDGVRFVRWIISGIITSLAVLIAVGAIVWPVGHAAISAVLLLPEFFPNAPARPLEWLTPNPVRSTVELRYDGQTSVADLYDPGSGRQHGGVIIFLGVAPAGLDDPRVIRLGESLARIGIVTLIPQSQDLVNSKVDPSEIDELVAGFDYLAHRPNVDAKRIGFGGFCIGASLALDAAEDPRINHQVALVNSFTGYYDLSSYIISILSHSIAPYPSNDQGRVPWEPASNATEVLNDHLISLDPDSRERQELALAVHNSATPRPDVSRLSSTGRTIWTLINTRDPVVATRLLNQLPPSGQQALARLSPSTRIADLHAKVFAMHDRDDSTVPYIQSRLLIAHLRPGQGEYDEFQIFNHVDPTESTSLPTLLGDAARLGWHMFQIVEILQGAVPVQHYG